MTIYIDRPGVYTLTHNVFENIVIRAAGVTLDGNGFTVRGDKSVLNSIGIQSIAASTTVTEVNVTGFGAGIHLGGAGSKVTYSNAYDCMARGIGVAGGNGTIDHCTAGNIGGLTAKELNGVTVGIAAWGDNNVVSYSNVHHILGAKESCGYSFGGNGGKLMNSLAQGQDSTGWSFGVWAGGSLAISNSYLHSWDDAVGNKGGITATNSTIKGYHAAALGGPIVDAGHIVTSQLVPNEAKYIRGTADRDHIVGGKADSLIVGMGGGDSLFGGPGKDIFACSPFGELTVLPDFTKGQDRISTNYYRHNNIVQNGDEATGLLATFLFNPESHILYFDRDGGGRAPEVQIAYIPYVSVMDKSDFYWV